MFCVPDPLTELTILNWALSIPKVWYIAVSAWFIVVHKSGYGSSEYVVHCGAQEWQVW